MRLVDLHSPGERAGAHPAGGREGPDRCKRGHSGARRSSARPQVPHGTTCPHRFWSCQRCAAHSAFAGDLQSVGPRRNERWGHRGRAVGAREAPLPAPATALQLRAGAPQRGGLGPDLGPLAARHPRGGQRLRPLPGAAAVVWRRAGCDGRVLRHCHGGDWKERFGPALPRQDLGADPYPHGLRPSAPARWSGSCGCRDGADHGCSSGRWLRRREPGASV
mmetsp:Transcript_86580/g.258382  ORF Transcript_86580/g.258382 Transcript_86580/m.258382 type:complete len:220 (-) Transcript_86580:1397-2056(-)